MSDGRVLASVDLSEEAERFQPLEDDASGRRAETLLKHDRLRVVLITMRSGAELREHTAPGPITIHALSGRFAVAVEEQERTLEAGGLIAIERSVKHAVRALGDGAFLLTIGWPGGSAGEIPA